MAPCSLSAWVELRRAKLAAKAIVLILRRCLAGWLAVQWVDDWIGAADLVIIDAPPHPETEARIAVRVARLVVVPVQPFPLDPVGDGGNTQNRARRGLIVVVNLVPPRSRLTECIGADLASTGTPIAATWIDNPVASAQAMALGLGVTKTPYDPRSADISALAENPRRALLGFEPWLERQESSADSISRRASKPPSEDSRPPSKRAITALPCTGDRPGRNGVASTMAGVVR